MKEIRFRAWNVRRFLRDDEYAILPNGKILVRDDSETDEGTHIFFDEGELSIILEQYTGLKDKNGVEIYEGDILAYMDKTCWNCKQEYPDDSHKHKPYTVSWDMDDLQFKCENASNFMCPSVWSYDMEVIGNIHEGGK